MQEQNGEWKNLTTGMDGWKPGSLAGGYDSDKEIRNYYL